MLDRSKGRAKAVEDLTAEAREEPITADAVLFGHVTTPPKDSGKPADWMVTLMWLSAGLFGLLVVLPASLLVAAIVCKLLLLGATELLARIGGFAQRTFDQSSGAAAVLLLGIGGAAGYAAFKHRRATGAGGQNPDFFTRHLSLTLGFVILVLLAVSSLITWRVGPFPDAVAGALALTALALCAFLAFVWSIRAGLWFLVGLCRFGVGSHYRAGALTATFIVASTSVFASVVVVPRVARALTANPYLREPLPSRDPEGITRHVLCATARDMHALSPDAPANTCSYLPMAIGATAASSSWIGSDAQKECFETAFKELTDFKPKWRRSFYLSDDDVADLVAEAVLDTCKKDRGISNFAGYATQVLKRRAQYWKQRAMRYRACELDDTVVPPTCPTVDEETQVRQLQVFLHRAWCELDDHQQQALELRYRDESGYQEIAEQLHLKDSQAARNTVHYALEVLGDALKKDCSFDDLHF